jgi:aminopeptidase N
MSFFLVEVNAPAAQSVVTSGVEIERVEMDGNQSITIAAGPVRDFYLAMSDRYDVVTDHVGAVQINSYAPRELLDGASLALESASHALRSYNERYGPYPYSELDIVSTPTLALGIEYPGIFANAIRIYDLSQNYASGLPNAVMVESVTAHETAHQWFYNLVGNDQLNEPWLDESVTQYATWMYYVDRYGAQAAQGYYDSLEGRWARNEFADIPIGLPAEAYSSEDYSPIVYGRGPIFLNELAQEMGQETFDAFLRDYSESLRWEIATTEDFLALAEAHCGCDLAALFEEAVYAR